MKYLVLFLLFMFSCNVNAETYKTNIEDYYKKLWEEVEKTKYSLTDFSSSCLIKNIYGKVNYNDRRCILTYHMLMKEWTLLKDSPSRDKIYLDAIRLKKHICAYKLSLYKRKKLDSFEIESYKYFCRGLEYEQHTYERYKNDCMKDEPYHPLVCFSYKFE